MDDNRDSNGRFRLSNAGGPENPLADKIGKLRAALVAVVTEEDVREIARGLIATAKGGDVRAIKELLDRTIGRPIETDLIERLEAMGAAMSVIKVRRENLA